MIFPILFVIGLAYYGWRIGDAARKSGVSVSIPAVEISGSTTRFRDLLRHRMRVGGPVTKWLVNEAMCEAYEAGDWDAASALATSFPDGASEKQLAPPVGGPDSEEGDVGPSDTVDSVDSVNKSPLDGVTDEEWAEFVGRLRTKPPGFSSDRYVGQFEQNRGRLDSLGLPAPDSPDLEYASMVKDVEDHNATSAQLIADFSGDLVDIGGVQHPVTWSGILGLLKAAGPDGARGWLQNPGDRTKFPRTTETFVRTNGCF